MAYYNMITLAREYIDIVCYLIDTIVRAII